MNFTTRLRRRALSTVLLAVACASAALAQGTAAPAAAPIRIGMIEGLSGPFANTGEAVYRNLVWATERVNARGGVKLPGGHRPLLAGIGEPDTEEAAGARGQRERQRFPAPQDAYLRRAEGQLIL